MGIGALFMLAFSGAFGGAFGVIYASAPGGASRAASARHNRMFRFYVTSMAALAWLTMLSGSYLVYPWRRAKRRPAPSIWRPIPKICCSRTR
jgi:hypothetical protein